MKKTILILTLLIYSSIALAAEVDYNSCEYSKSLEFESAVTEYGVSNSYDPGRIIKVYNSDGDKIDEFNLENGKKKYTTLEQGKNYKIDIYSCPYLEEIKEEPEIIELSEGSMCNKDSICESGTECVDYTGSSCEDSNSIFCGCCEDGLSWDSSDKRCVKLGYGWTVENVNEEIEEVDIKNECVKLEETETRGDVAIKGDVRKESYCVNDKDIIKYKCENNQIKEIETYCLSSFECRQGECRKKEVKQKELVVKEVPKQFCDDTDGEDYYVRGTLRYTGGEAIDVCKDRKTLVEYFCNEGKPAVRSIVLQGNQFCENGVVKEEEIPEPVIEKVIVEEPVEKEIKTKEDVVLEEKEDNNNNLEQLSKPTEEKIEKEPEEKKEKHIETIFEDQIHLEVSNFTVDSRHRSMYARFGIEVDKIFTGRKDDRKHLLKVVFRNTGDKNRSIYLIPYIEGAKIKRVTGKFTSIDSGESSMALYEITLKEDGKLNPRFYIYEYRPTKYIVDVFFRLGSLFSDSEKKEDNVYQLAEAKIDVDLEAVKKEVEVE